MKSSNHSSKDLKPMTDLSPQAQAVAHAYDNTPEKQTGNHRYHWLAAALRAAVDQVVPEPAMIVEGGRTYEQAWTATVHCDIRNRLLTIAAELELLNF
jgi:hypothetical protein